MEAPVPGPEPVGGQGEALKWAWPRPEPSVSGLPTGPSLLSLGTSGRYVGNGIQVGLPLHLVTLTRQWQCVMLVF